MFSATNMTDEQYMEKALAIAAYASGRTSPNPLVGAVIVSQGRIIGQGWHRQAGTPHAEIHALLQAGVLARGATMYVTLEPCSHQGRTGPCADAVIRAGIKKVVIGMIDPNPAVAGQGIAKLKAAGLEVVTGVLAAKAASLNEVFIKWIATGLPFGILKTAMTLDGKIATYTGHSRWITGPQSRQRVHVYRDRYDAILAGIGTVLADDPLLTARLPAGNGQNPVRVIVDSMARLPLAAQLVKDHSTPTLLAVGPQAPRAKLKQLRAAGIEPLVLEKTESGLNLRQLFTAIGKRNLTSVFVEGGATVNAALLQENLIDKVYCFIAPKLVGGTAAPGPYGGQGMATMDAAIELEDMHSEVIGEDILLSGKIRRREGRDVYRTCGGIGESQTNH